MSTISDILNHALRLNRQRNVSTDRVNEALKAFNLMLKSWGDVIDTPVKESFTLVVGTYEYSIGSSGDFDTVKPVNLVSAYIEDSDGTSHGVELTLSSFNYDQISDKDISERPDRLYYDTNYSTNLGRLYFNSAPSSADTFYLTSHKSITTYSDTTTTLALPVEWEEALIYNLAVRLAPEYGMRLDPVVFQIAEKSREDIMSFNNIAPVAEFDEALLR